MAKRRWKRWVLGALAVVVVLAVGGPFVFIHFIEGSPKPELALPSTTTVPASDAQPASSSSVAGTWQVASGSQAGYRVSEVLAGQSTTAVGRTSSVTGRFVIAGTTVTMASFTVQMGTVVSNQSQRNAQFDGRIMDVAQYPTAVFTLTNPISLGRIPTAGTVVHVDAAGHLDMRRRLRHHSRPRPPRGAPPPRPHVVAVSCAPNARGARPWLGHRDRSRCR
jgi:polyisoprenoid-binding protein YceI